tara:strand:- start:1253 stop:1525 length:273 start_codon:yes stop_codon:yes gene_type:complete
MSQFKQYLREAIHQAMNEYATPARWSPSLQSAEHLNPKLPDLVMDPWGRGWLPRDHPDLGIMPGMEGNRLRPANPGWQPNPDASPPEMQS